MKFWKRFLTYETNTVLQAIAAASRHTNEWQLCFGGIDLHWSTQ